MIQVRMKFIKLRKKMINLMLIKMIKCEVNHNMRSLFHNAQSNWTQLSSVPGFVIQFGGWNKTTPQEAYIFGVWSSLDRYAVFMNEDHDRIMNGNNQKGTYESIEVSLWNTSERISVEDIDAMEYIELSYAEDDVNNRMGYKTFLLTSLAKENEAMRVKCWTQVNELTKNGAATQIKRIKDWTVISNL